MLWDPNRRETIRQEILHHGADYTPYEGLAVTGWPVMTILRGQVVMEDGRILGAPGGGQFLPPRAVALCGTDRDELIPTYLADRSSPEELPFSPCGRRWISR